MNHTFNFEVLKVPFRCHGLKENNGWASEIMEEDRKIVLTFSMFLAKVNPNFFWLRQKFLETQYFNIMPIFVYQQILVNVHMFK